MIARMEERQLFEKLMIENLSKQNKGIIIQIQEAKLIPSKKKFNPTQTTMKL